MNWQNYLKNAALEALHAIIFIEKLSITLRIYVSIEYLYREDLYYWNKSKVYVFSNLFLKLIKSLYIL